MDLVYSHCGVERKPFSHGVLSVVLLSHAGLLLALANRQVEAPSASMDPPILISLIQAEAALKPVVAPAPVAIEPVPPIFTKPARRLPAPIAERQPAAVADPAPQLAVPTAAPMATAEQKISAVAETISPTQAESAGSEAAALPVEEPLELPRFQADYLDNPPPAYPPISRKLGEHGRVLLRVRVSADGQPVQVLLREPSGHARLDERAIETVRQWKFVPARQGGRAVEAWVIVPIQFSLKG